MKIRNIIQLSDNEFVLRKPDKAKSFAVITLILAAAFGIYSYLITDEFRLRNLRIVLERIGILLTVFLFIWLYQYWLFRRNREIVICKVEKFMYMINGRKLTLMPDEFYVKGNVYGNSAGRGVYSIYLSGKEVKILIASKLGKDEYAEISKGLCEFLQLPFKESR